jgi:putative dehydrogenase
LEAVHFAVAPESMGTTILKLFGCGDEAMQERVKVGVIGIGAMGMGIAKCLRTKGYAVSVRDVRLEAEHEASSLGMTVCETPAGMAARVDVVIVVVLNAQQIAEVLFGEQGVAHGVAKDATQNAMQKAIRSPEQVGKKLTVLLCSTIAPEDSVRFAERLAQYGIDCLDAPISGGPAKAESGTMSMMLAGAARTLDRCEQLLADMSGRRFHISEKVGDGARTKLVNNLLAGTNLVAGAEALALGIKMGLDPKRLFDVICASSGSSWVFEDRMARALENDYTPRAFAHILTKDMTLATGMAHSVGHDTPLGDAALGIYRETLERGWADLDDGAVLKTFLERRGKEQKD